MNTAEVPVRLTHTWKRQGDTVVLFSDAHFNLVRLEFNQIGGRVWELVDGKRTVEEIVDQIHSVHPRAHRPDIEASVVGFLEELRGEWLVMTTGDLAAYE